MAYFAGRFEKDQVRLRRAYSCEALTGFSSWRA